MADFAVNVDSKNQYRDSLNRLHQSITENSWARLVRHNSSNVHTVAASHGGVSVRFRLQEKDLYLIGFETESGKWHYFKDFGGCSENTLAIESSYTSVDGLGVLRTELKNVTWQKDEIREAISTLRRTRVACDTDFRRAFGIFTFSISEAPRFHEVFQKVQLFIGSGATIRFSDFESLVKSWGKHSDGRQLSIEKSSTGPVDMTQHDVLKRLKTVLQNGKTLETRGRQS